MRAHALVLALVAATGTASYHSLNSQSPVDGRTPENTLAAIDGSEASTTGLAQTFSAFDKRRRFTIRAGEAKACLTTRPLPNIKFEAPGSPLAFDFVMAIVPDPEHSNLKLDFDRHIETIQLAAAGEGYRFERFWFPWATEKAASQPYYPVRAPDLGADTQRMLSVLASYQRQGVEGLPGVLLFRNPSGGDPLAVFLVSESPTAGISADEFRNATCLGRTLSKLGGRPQNDDLRVIGPGLSGSLQSLMTLINLQLPQFRKVVIRSWTSDANSHQEFRRGLNLAALSGQNGENKAKSYVDFQLTDEEFSMALDKFSVFLRDVWHDSNPIVLLTEEETAFGTGATMSDAGPKAKTAGSVSRLHGGQPLYTIPFPRNLSQLRNATEKQDHLPGFGDDSRRVEAPRNGLLFSLKQEANASLDLPTYSKEQTPISQESVLFTIGGLLKTGSVHYAGIVATDPLDTLFLTRYLRTACPNLRVFTAHPDLLFEHGSDTSDYSGILAISGYPLVPLSQLWHGPRSQIYPFPSEPSEAIYNAALDILHGLSGSPNHKGRPDFRDVGNPFDPNHKAGLWITVAGRTGFQPIDVLPGAQHGPGLADPEPGAKRRLVPQYWPGWGYAFSILLMLCITYCSLMLFARPDGHQALAVFSAEPDPYVEDYNPIPRAFFLFSMGLCLGVLTALWLVVPGSLIMQNVPREIDHPVETAAAGLLLTGLLVVVAFEIRRRSTPVSSQLSLVPVTGMPPANRSTLAFMVAGPFLLAMQVLLRLHAVLPYGQVFVVLWTLFCIGCVCLGGVLAASVIPVSKVVRAEIAHRNLSKGGIVRHFAREPYAYGSLAVLFIAGVLFVAAALAILSRFPVTFLAAYRSLDLTNGVSPLVPLTLLFTALLVTTLTHLRRIAYFEDRRPEVPDMEGDEFCPKLKEIVDQIKTRIQKFDPHPADYGIAALLLLITGLVLFGAAQTLEEWSLETVLLASSIAVGLFIMVVWIRVVLIWLAFSEFLQQLERHPIRHVFSLLPRGFMWSPVWQGGGKKRTHVAITRSLECMLALRDHRRTPKELKDCINEELHSWPGNHLRENITNLLETSAKRERFSLKKSREIEGSLRNVANAASEHLSAKWRRGDYELRSELATKEQTKDALHMPRPEYLKEEPNTICGELVAFRFLAFINFTLWHIDNLVGYISIGFLLLVVAINSYAFRARTIIDWMLVLMFLILTTGIVAVFAQADRDAMLSRITGTEEGKLDRHFFQHLFSYGAMPALVLVATHFPTVGRFFFSWVKPAIEAIH